MTDTDKIHRIQELLKRRIETPYPSSDEVVQKLSSSEKLTVYFGIDPTGADIHLGHTIPLFLLKNVAELGHDAVLLIGDFTASIGDPTGKASVRTTLTGEEIQENMVTYLDQVTKIIPKDLFRVSYNSEWLSTLSLDQLLALGKRVTVQQLLQRDMFQERLKAEKPIHVNEFLYPLMQGYDSVALRADGEIGGSDQTFNMLIGRDLERDMLGKEKIVLTTRLLVDAKGKKMSKSEGNLIALNDSPQEIRRKILDIDDTLIRTVFELCTEKEMSWIDEQFQEGSKPNDPRAMKEALAAELIRMYHGEEAVLEAHQALEITHTGALDKVLVASGAVASMSAAKKLIDQGGVGVNGVKADRWDIEIKSGDEIKIGKGKFVKVK